MSLNVVWNVLKEGRNLVAVEGIKKNEKFDNLYDFKMKSSNGVEETIGVFNDINRTNGVIRSFIRATIYEEGMKVYNLEECIGKQVIVDLESATSKSGNIFWKIKRVEKVTKDTNLDEFEFEDEIQSDTINTQKISNVNDISDLEDLMD